MNYKNRLKVHVMGDHPLLEEVKANLHAKGVVLIDCPNEGEDIVIFGGDSDPAWHPNLEINPNVKVLLLSSYCIFKGTELRGPVDEGCVAGVHPLADFAEQALNYLFWENHFLNRFDCMVVRTFPTFGGPEDNLITKLVKQAEDCAPNYNLIGGDRQRSWLHISDFHTGFEKLLDAFVSRNVQGIFNLGSQFTLRISEVTAAVYQAHGLDYKSSIDEDWWDMPWRPRVLVPDMTRTFSVTKWKPRVSLRAGLTPNG